MPLPDFFISIHAPRMGSDGSLPTWFRLNANFNPRSPDGERRSDHCRCHYRPEISIHAPRMGSDYAPLICFNVCSIFQSTLPGWGATPNRRTGTWCYLFQSTLPGWGATIRSMVGSASVRYFNPRSPDGERRTSLVTCAFCCIFQSTLPGWGATKFKTLQYHAKKFQSTLPGWGATSFRPSNSSRTR